MWRRSQDKVFHLYAQGASVFEREDAPLPRLRHYVRFTMPSANPPVGRREVDRATVVVLPDRPDPSVPRDRHHYGDTMSDRIHALTVFDIVTRLRAEDDIAGPDDGPEGFCMMCQTGTPSIAGMVRCSGCLRVAPVQDAGHLKAAISERIDLVEGETPCRCEMPRHIEGLRPDRCSACWGITGVDQRDGTPL
ncbi:hypothetical protein SEA_KNOCKER_81 [Mycobacterium phage Knocker]|nr:hypothetical protein SEA_KNOCKER_81 [Mycobacterium phage Knocker]